MGTKTSKTEQSSEAEDTKTNQIQIDYDDQYQLDDDTTDIPYSVQCQYLIHGYIKSIASKYHDHKYIPGPLKTLCLMFYGDKLVDTVIVSSNGDIDCDILKRYLFPNGLMNKGRYKEFDDKQRFELYWIPFGM